MNISIGTCVVHVTSEQHLLRLCRLMAILGW